VERIDTSVVTNTLILSGHVIQGGVRFLWWVIDGKPSRLTVSHPVNGTRTVVLAGEPEELARRLASQILADNAARHAADNPG
jgi:hypothetical protein